MVLLLAVVGQVELQWVGHIHHQLVFLALLAQVVLQYNLEVLLLVEHKADILILAA
jgi:hypothetical protein